MPPLLKRHAQTTLVGAALTVMLLMQTRAALRLLPRWAGWKDQGYYLQSARAFASGNLDPTQHHFPPGYSLLAAPFVPLLPSCPFLIPDLLCAAASLILFTRICRRLKPDWPFAAAIAALCYLAATTLSTSALPLWAIPWTTTAMCPLILLCSLMALRFADAAKPRDAAGLGLSASLGVMVRPSDALVAFLPAALFCAHALWRLRPQARQILYPALALAAGLAMGLLASLALHTAVHGIAPGEYGANLVSVGFEPRLIFLRWVTLAISPRPLFPNGIGMAAVFPWLLPGVAGMLLMATGKSPAAGRHALIAATVCLYWALYLAYRDLDSESLWRYNIVHYFKWTLPFLAFWAVCLGHALWLRPSRRAAALAIAVTVLATLWRPEFIVRSTGQESASPQSAAIPGGLAPFSHITALQAHGDWQALSGGHSTASVGNKTLRNNYDFKLFPIPGGVMIMPLRPVPPGDATLNLSPDTSFVPPVHFVSGNWALVPGLPWQ